MEFFEKIMPNEPIRLVQAELDRLLLFCQHENASDITLQTNEPAFADIYGRLYHVTKRKLTNAEVSEMLNAIYGPNGSTQLLTGHDIDTHYEIRPSRTERYRYRVNATAIVVEGHEGIQITFRAIPGTPPPLSSLDLPKDLKDAIAPLEGVVYVTGATGSGKSTLLASIIRYIAEEKSSHRKILTYEAPIEFVYDEVPMATSLVAQSEIPRNLPSFDYGVRNALRRNPRLILVGEARDADTMGAVLEAAMTGHPVYTTLHTNGVAETIRRLVATFPADERHGRTIDIIETIRVSVWQRLAPTVDGKRVALREYLIFSEEIRDELLATHPDEITASVRRLVKEKGQPMVVDAERKYKEGIISERTYKLLVAGTVMSDKDAGS